MQISLFHFHFISIHCKYKFWTFSLNFRYYFFNPLLTVLFTDLFQSCYSLSKRNHTLAQWAALLMYFQLDLLAWRAHEAIEIAPSSLNKGQTLPTLPIWALEALTFTSKHPLLLPWTSELLLRSKSGDHNCNSHQAWICSEKQLRFCH